MITPRELWLLNFYRNSELHGALLMGRLARSFADAGLAANLTRHCATEARHAAMLTEALAALGGPVDLDTGTIQERYGDAGGRPAELLDLLVLSEILEKRVLASYRAHLARTDVQARVRATLEAIVREMEAEEDGHDPHAGWIDRALDAMPADAVARAKARWGEVDARVARDLIEMLEQRFAATDDQGLLPTDGRGVLPTDGRGVLPTDGHGVLPTDGHGYTQIGSNVRRGLGAAQRAEPERTALSPREARSRGARASGGGAPRAGRKAAGRGGGAPRQTKKK